MNNDKTLVHIPQPPKAVDESAVETDTKSVPPPFSILLQGISNIQTTGHSPIPHMRVVLDGIWAVMQGIAQRYQLSVDTEHDAWKVVAVIADRLINVGLTMLGTDQAVEKFKTEVLDPTYTDLRSMAGKTTMPAHKLWQERSMKFFAQLFRLGRETIETMNATYRKLVERNRVHGGEHDVLLHSELGSMNHLTSAPMLDPNLFNFSIQHSHRWAKGGQVYTTILKRQADYQRYNELQQQLVELPKAAVGRNEEGGSTSYNYELINTQLLLAANKAPLMKRYLDTEEVLPFLKRFKSLKKTAQLRAFWNRMRAMGYPHEQPPKALAEVVAKAAVEMSKRKLDSHRSNFTGLYLVVDFSKVKGASLNDRRHQELAAKHSKGGRLDDSFFAKTLLKKVDWDETTNEEVDSWLRELKNRNNAIKLLERLSPKRRREMAQKWARDPSLSGKLLYRGWIRLENAELRTDLLELQEKKSWFLKLLAKFRPHNAKSLTRAHSEDFSSDLFELGENIGAKWLRAQLRAPRKRRAATYALEELHIQCARYNGGHPLEDHLPNLLGNKLFLLLVLADEVDSRLAIYKEQDMDDEDDEAGKCLCGWEDQVDKPTLAKQQLKSMSPLTEERTKAFLKKYSEEAVWRWLYEADPATAETIIDDMRKARAKYYARKHAEGHSVPVAYRPSSPP